MYSYAAHEMCILQTVNVKCRRHIWRSTKEMEEKKNAKSGKTTKELKKDLDRITEKYERALEKDNRRIADVVRKYFGDEPDMERLDDVLSKAANNFSTFVSSGKGSPAGKVQTVPRKEKLSEEQDVPTDLGGADDE